MALAEDFASTALSRHSMFCYLFISFPNFAFELLFMPNKWETLQCSAMYP